MVRRRRGFEGLAHRLVLGHGDQHDIGSAVAGDREVVMLAGDAVGEFGDPCLRLRDGDGLHEAMIVTGLNSGQLGGDGSTSELVG